MIADTTWEKPMILGEGAYERGSTDPRAANDRVVDAVLEGGPEDIPEALRSCRVTATDMKVKVSHRGGYEHFERASELGEEAIEPVTFRWIMRTRVAE